MPRSQAFDITQGNNLQVVTPLPVPGEHMESLRASLCGLLDAMAPHEPSAPAAVAYRAAIRRRGQDAVTAGGPVALDYLLRLVTEEHPNRAEDRKAILCFAWDGLPGWHA